jgi:hypothetical protein
VFDGQLAQYNYLELLCNIIFFNVCDAAACTKRVASTGRQQIDASSTMHDGCVYAPVFFFLEHVRSCFQYCSSVVGTLHYFWLHLVSVSTAFHGFRPLALIINMT